jgi:hypothetical protein
MNSDEVVQQVLGYPYIHIVHTLPNLNISSSNNNNRINLIIFMIILNMNANDKLVYYRSIDAAHVKFNQAIKLCRVPEVLVDKTRLSSSEGNE